MSKHREAGDPVEGAGMRRRRFVAGAALGPWMATAWAQSSDPFPNRPLRMVVPFVPGNSTDQIARSVSEAMRQELKQPLIVENRAGANAIIASQFVATQPADGYTLFFASDSALVLNALLYKAPGYSAERDFTPLSQAVDVPLVMLVNEQVPARSVAEFVRYAKAHPKKLNFGSTGTGGAFHLTGELFKHAAGIEMTHVPYKGGNAAVQAMLSGDVQVMFGVVGSSLQLIRAGRLRPLAVCTKSRVPVLPDTPTISESGYTGFEATVRYGIVVAAQTPKPVPGRLVDATVKAVDSAGFRSHWTQQGYIVPERLGPASYAAALASDREVWGRLIRSQNITLEE